MVTSQPSMRLTTAYSYSPSPFRPMPSMSPRRKPLVEATVITPCLPTRSSFTTQQEGTTIMTLYATSNVVATTVPAENGGCGTEHRRPVISGAPQHPWGLVCPPCEDFLRKNNSDQWSITTSEIPETYD